MLYKLRGIGLIIAIGIPTVACGSAPATDSQNVASVSGQLIASVTTAGHTVRFVEGTPGDIFIGETFPTGEKPILSDAFKGQTLASIYHYLQPDVAVPQAIVDGDSRVAKARASKVDVQGVAGSPPPENASVAAPRFYTNAEWAAFQANTCRGASTCDRGSYPFIATYTYSQNYSTYGMLGSDSSSASAFILQQWQGAWVTLYSTYVSPGQSAWWWRTESPPCGAWYCYHRGGFSGGTFGDYMVAQK